MTRGPRRRIRAVTVAMALALAASIGIPSVLAAATPSGAAGSTGELRLLQVRQSLLGRHFTYQQTYRGVDVLGGYLQRHAGNDGTVSVTDGRLAVHGLGSILPEVAAAAAGATGLAKVRGPLVRTTLAILAGAPARLVWSVETEHSDRILVDAMDGQVIRVESLARYVDGSGKVFDPNPVVKLQNEGLTDQGDVNTAVPDAAYRVATLHHLDGSGYLRGTYARIVPPTASLAHSASHTYNYKRASNKFEQVNAYYAVDRVQSYLHQIGFTDVNNESQDLKIDTITDDNSFYAPSNDSITFGTGGVDDAEDVEVIWHEYGHAVQDDQVPGFGTTEQAGAIGEGFGDYLGMTMSQARSPDSATTPWACLMDWDSTSYTAGTPHCIRRTDTNKVYPDDMTGEVHDDGEIWSRALYDINLGLGRNRANRIIIEAQFLFSPGTTFLAAAQRTVNTANALYGSAARALVKAAFNDRGIAAT
jgi:Zn-dependent metalloprotease